jgi:hypothetical protein
MTEKGKAAVETTAKEDAVRLGRFPPFQNVAFSKLIICLSLSYDDVCDDGSIFYYDKNALREQQRLRLHLREKERAESVQKDDGDDNSDDNGQCLVAHRPSTPTFRPHHHTGATQATQATEPKRYVTTELTVTVLGRNRIRGDSESDWWHPIEKHDVT